MSALACKPAPPRSVFEINNLNVCFSQERPLRSQNNQANEGRETANSGHVKEVLAPKYLACDGSTSLFDLVIQMPQEGSSGDYTVTAAEIKALIP